MKRKIESVGPTGAIVAAAACPICFPKLAAIGTLFGLGALAPFETYFIWGAQFLVVITLVVQILAYRERGNRLLLSAFVAFTALFFLSLYAIPSEAISYIALAGIVLGSTWSIFN